MGYREVVTERVARDERERVFLAINAVTPPGTSPSRNRIASGTARNAVGSTVPVNRTPDESVSDPRASRPRRD